jgi:hypothetical protein
MITVSLFLLNFCKVHPIGHLIFPSTNSSAQHLGWQLFISPEGQGLHFCFFFLQPLVFLLFTVFSLTRWKWEFAFPDWTFCPMWCVMWQPNIPGKPQPLCSCNWFLKRTRQEWKLMTLCLSWWPVIKWNPTAWFTPSAEQNAMISVQTQSKWHRGHGN